jgi:hypothetical protein
MLIVLPLFRLFFHVAVREDRLIRMINAVPIVARPLRRPRAGQPPEWVVVPARAPIVPRVATPSVLARFHADLYSILRKLEGEGPK